MFDNDSAQEMADSAILLLARLILVVMGLIHFEGLPGLLILLFALLSIWPLGVSQTGKA